MTNLFEPVTANEIIARVNKLTPETPAQWGKMNVSQMLAHCQVFFELYFGEKKMKRGLIGFLFGGIAKKKLFSNEPWKHGLPTHKLFIIADQREFNKEQDKLTNWINRFVAEGKKIAPSEHPFFGKMSTDDWARLAYKHTDHHLKQFGA